MSFHFSRSQKNHRLSGLIYLTFGIIFLLIFSGYRFHQARTLSFFTKEAISVSTERTGQIPVYIKSYPLGVDIKVSESVIKDGIWQVFPEAISHLASSARIGEKGNIVLYGHNKDDVLGPIRYAKIGEKIELYDAAGKKYLYSVVKTDTVNPDNLTYILPTKEETLTVYTCIGFFDRQRFVAVAKPVTPQ